MNNKINSLETDSDRRSQTSDTQSTVSSKLAIFLDSNQPALETRTKVLVLQHPQEKREALATLALLRKCLPETIVKVGLSWPNLKKILGREADSSRWAVIYLGTQAESDKLKKSGAPISMIGRAKKLSDLEGIIVLDGSWREAKAMWWRNAWLLKLNRIVLNPAKPAIYNALRKEPRSESVSTLEAVAMVLAEIENRTEIYEQLSSALVRMVEVLGVKHKKAGPRRDWRRKRGKPGRPR